MLAITRVLSYLWLPFLLILVWNTINHGIVYLTSDLDDSHTIKLLKFTWNAIPAFFIVPTLDIVISRSLLKGYGIAVPQESLNRILKTKTVAFWKCWIPLTLGSSVLAFALVIPGVVFFARRMYFVYFLALNNSDAPVQDSKRLVNQAPKTSYLFAFFSLISYAGMTIFLTREFFISFIGECLALFILSVHEVLVFSIEAYFFKTLYTRESPLAIGVGQANEVPA